MLIYTPHELVEQLGDLQVTKILVAAHDEAIGLKFGDNDKLNHWGMYVQVQNNSDDYVSVALDMRAGPSAGKVNRVTERSNMLPLCPLNKACFITKRSSSPVILVCDSVAFV